MDEIAAVFGRLHPLLLHLPIGLVVGVAALEAVALWRGRRAGDEASAKRIAAAPSGLVWLTAIAAVAAAATGLKLAQEESYGGDLTLDIHQWLGLSVAAVAVVAAGARAFATSPRRLRTLKLYRGSLAVTFLLILGAGHFGAVITHGENFLFQPLLAGSGSDGGAGDGLPAQPMAVTGTPADWPPGSEQGFGTVAPIFAERCLTCHGARPRGGLRLDSFQALARGGENGLVISAEFPEDSELLRRVSLPDDDPDRMPPPGRRPLSPEEIATVRAWVLGSHGAPAQLAEAGDQAPPDAPPVTEAGAAASPDSAAQEPADEQPGVQAAPVEPPVVAVPVGPPDASAVAALRGTLAHVAPLAEDSPLLWIDIGTARPALEEPEILELLRPLAANIADLSLARCAAGDAVAELAASMPNLRRLNLHGTAVTDAGVQKLAGHPALRELVLTGTAVTDGAIDVLVAMPALSRVYVWGSGLTTEGVERLAGAREGLVAEAGALADAAVLEAEPEVALGATGAPPAQAATPATLEPVNKTCPVSDKPVDAKYLVVHEGRVIGFCCPECPKQFWADPAKFIEKLNAQQP